MYESLNSYYCFFMAGLAVKLIFLRDRASSFSEPRREQTLGEKVSVFLGEKVLGVVFILFWVFILWLIALLATWIIYKISHALYYLLVIASSTAAGVYIVGFFVPLKNYKLNEAINKEMTKMEPFDLSSMNFVKLTEELNNLLNRPNSETLIGKWWESQHFSYDQERLDHIINYIRKLRQANEQLGGLQHELFVAPKVLEYAIKGSYVQLEQEAELQIALHRNKKQQISDEMRGRQILLESAELANLKMRMEINQMQVMTEETRARTNFIAFVLKNITAEDLHEMPDTLKTYLISSIVNPQGTQFQDFDMQERLKQFIERDADAKSRHASAVASQAEQQARIAEGTADKTIYELNATRNSPKR